MADLKKVFMKYYVIVLLAMFIMALTLNVNAQIACNSDQDCPRKLCCSRFGYCGEGPDYCDH